MDSSSILSRQGHRLLQIGVALFLLTSFEGLCSSLLRGAEPRTVDAYAERVLGRSAAGAGLVWPRLDLGAAASWTAFWLLIYSDFATVASFCSPPSGERATQSCRWWLELRTAAIFRRPRAASWRIRRRRPASRRSRSFSLGSAGTCASIRAGLRSVRGMPRSRKSSGKSRLETSTGTKWIKASGRPGTISRTPTATNSWAGCTANICRSCKCVRASRGSPTTRTRSAARKCARSAASSSAPARTSARGRNFSCWRARRRRTPSSTPRCCNSRRRPRSARATCWRCARACGRRSSWRRSA